MIYIQMFINPLICYRDMPIRLTEEKTCWLHGITIHVNNKCQKCKEEDNIKEEDNTDKMFEQYYSDRADRSDN